MNGIYGVIHLTYHTNIN